ncbi:MAG: DUF1844 domain-containing protein [Candidatus Bathyarchaeota archaeon]|nr:DUF1844 domain-containing protein [Candidatus Bathyarchaeota archaeon]
MSSEDKDKKHDDQQTSGFKVEDRRKFSSEGEPIPEKQAEDSSEASQAPFEQSQTQESTSSAGGGEIDFAGFLFSLATSAMAHLGEVPDPASGKTSENLPAAKQMIDILSLLQEKTKGNLEADEDRILEDLLYELRMKYLKKNRIIKL